MTRNPWHPLNHCQKGSFMIKEFTLCLLALLILGIGLSAGYQIGKNTTIQRYKTIKEN